MNDKSVMEMLDTKIEKYLLRKKGLTDIPVGLIKYGEEYKKSTGDKTKQQIIMNMIKKEIKAFNLNKSRVSKALGIDIK